MSADSTDAMFQKCLEGLAAGLSAEECLSAYPEQRAELEPLLRQALRLKMAYVSSPREEFRESLKTKLMFAAGREARESLSAEPDPEFVARTRRRLMIAAGSHVQESLRAVPPPRLAFWMNARRRLLGEAAKRPMRPVPQPMALAMRTGMSFTVLLIAAFVAGAVLFTTQGRTPSVGAEFAAIDQELRELQQLQDSGQAPPAERIVDVTERVALISEKVSKDTTPRSAVAEKLPALVDRAANVVSTAREQGAPAPELAPAQQNVNHAEENVRVLAARAADTPTTAPSPAAPTATSSGPSSSPTPAATVRPTQTSTPVATPGANQLRVVAAPDDRTFDIAWAYLTTQRYQGMVPAGWRISPETNDAGFASLDGPNVIFYGPDGPLVINVETGQITAVVNGSALVLRQPSGALMPLEELIARAPSGLVGVLRHVAETAVFIPPTPTPTSTPVPSATP